MPLSVARIYVGIPLVRDESENPSLCSREMTYCSPGIWVLHRAWRRGIIRDSSFACPRPAPLPLPRSLIRLRKMDHQINRRASDTRERFRDS